MKFLNFLRLLFCLFLLQAVAVKAQSNMKSPVKIETPFKIKKLVKGKIAETRTIDFDGDKKADYIVYVSDESKDGELGTKLWINASLKIVKRELWTTADYDFLWFINLDEDPIPEIISAFGYSDGIDYAIYKQNFSGKKDTLLLAFNPVIVDRSRNNEMYWGFPWDISDVLIESGGKKIELFCSFDHDIERETYNSNPPNWQKKVPVIFFSGKTTQPDAFVKNVKTKRWLGVSDIIREAKKK